MALGFVKLSGAASEGGWTCDRRLCLTEDRTRVVPEDSTEARWLWATPGDEVSLAEAIRLGAVTPEPEAEPEPAPVEDAEPEDKPKPAAKRAAAKDSSTS